MAAKYNRMKILSALEVEDKMEKGLCLFCDEQFTLEHQLKHENIQIVVTECDEEEYEFAESNLTNGVFNECFSDSMLADDEDTEKLQNITSNPVSAISAEMKNHDVSYVVSDLNDTHGVSYVQSDTPTRKEESSIETKYTSTHFLTTPQQLEPPNTSIPEFKKSETPLNVQEKFTPTYMTIMSWYWVRILRKLDLELDWEKLIRTLSNGTLLIEEIPPKITIVEFTSYSTTIDYHLMHNYEVNPYLNTFGAFLELFCIFNSAVRDSVTTTKGLVATQHPYVYSFKILQTFLQLFDEMPKCHIAIWNGIIRRCTNNELEDVALDLFKDMHRRGNTSISYIFYDILILRYLKLLSYGDMLVILLSLQFKGMMQSLMCKYILERFEVLNALIRVSNYQFLKVNKPSSKALLPIQVDRVITNKSLPHVSSSCKWEVSTLVALNVFGGKLIDAPSICKMLALQLQPQLKLTLEVMAFSLKCCVLNLESQRLFATKSVNRISSQLLKDFYVEQDVAFMRNPKNSYKSLTFVNDKRFKGALNFSIEYFLNMMPHILEFVSLILNDKFKKHFKGVSEENMKISFYSLDFVKGKTINKQNPMNRSTGELLYEHFIGQRYEAKEVKLRVSRISPEFPSLQKGLNGVGKKCLYTSELLLLLLANFEEKNGIMNLVSEQSQSLYLIALGSSVGTHALVHINDGKNKEFPNISGPMDSYRSCVVLTKSHLQVAKCCASLFDDSMDRESGDERVEKSDSLLKVVRKNVVLFKNLEMNSLKRMELKFRHILQYYENEFIVVLIFECQGYYLLGVLHRKMIPRGELLVLQSVIFKFYHENVAWNLDCIMLAIASCVNKGSVLVTKILLKWRDLPPKHGTWEFDLMFLWLFMT